MNPQKKILFITYGGGHVDIAARLAAKIQSNPALDYQILALTTAGKALESTNLSFKRCLDYLPLEGYEDALEIGTRLSEEIWDSSSGIPFEDSCAYLGVSMLDLIDTHGKKKAWEEYQRKGRKALLPVRFITKIIQKENPNMVVTTCHVRMERAATLAARKMGITTALVDDLYGYSMLGETPFDVNQPAFDRSEWPDRIVVLNEFIRQRLLKAGFEEWRVLPLGQPVFAEWAETIKTDTNHCSNNTTTQVSPKRITYFTPARRDVLYEQTQELLRLARERKNWEFVFKLHPSVGMNEYSEKIGTLPANVSLIKDENLIQTVQNSDLVITFKSTVSLLTIMCKIPLIILDCTGEREYTPYISQGAAKGVHDYLELESAIEKSFQDKNQFQTSSEIFHCPSDASEQIIKMFENIT